MRSTKSRADDAGSDGDSVISQTPNPSFRPPVPCIVISQKWQHGAWWFFHSIDFIQRKRPLFRMNEFWTRYHFNICPILRLLIWMLCWLIDHRGHGQRVQPPAPKPDQRPIRWLLLVVERAMFPTVPPAQWVGAGHADMVQQFECFWYIFHSTNRCQNRFSATTMINKSQNSSDSLFHGSPLT